MFQGSLIGVAKPPDFEAAMSQRRRLAGGDIVKESLLSPFDPRQTSSGALESLKEHTEDSIELLMEIDSDMNPFRDKLVLNEIIADIRKASSTQELRRVVNECLDAVKNVVATYVELDRVIEEVQGKLTEKQTPERQLPKDPTSHDGPVT